MSTQVNFVAISTADIVTALTPSFENVLKAIAAIQPSGGNGGLTSAQATELQTAATDAAQALTQLTAIQNSLGALTALQTAMTSANNSLAALATAIAGVDSDVKSGDTTLSTAIAQADSDVKAAQAALATAISQVDSDVKTISGNPPSPPPPPPPPPPNSPPPPPPPPPSSGGGTPSATWGSGLEGYDPSMDVAEISTNTNFTAFRKAITPPLASGQTVTMPAGTMGPGDLIENIASDPLYTAGELFVVGGGAKATDLTIPNMTKSAIDDLGESNPNMTLFWNQAGILPRCQRAHFSNIMFYRCSSLTQTGVTNAAAGGASGLRDMAGFVELMTIDGCYFLLCEDGVQTCPNDSNIPANARFTNGCWLILKSSVFNNCGVTTDGRSHCAYINGIRVDTENNTFNNVGHGYCIKSRAPNGTHVNNVMVNVNDGGLYDFPQGGVHTIFGGRMTNAATATSKWVLRMGEEGTGVYGLKQPAGQNFLYVGGGAIIDFLRPGGNALQCADGCTMIFDSTCVFNFPPGGGWQDIEQDVSGTGKILISGVTPGFTQAPFAAPTIPTIPPLGTPLGF